MQPVARRWRPGGMYRTRSIAPALLAVAMALAAGTVPVAQVAACSCASSGTPEEVVAGAELAFIGTVMDTAAGGPSEFGGSNVRYAFAVERASVATGQLVVVQALDDPGGASCGVQFGMGERWLVIAYLRGADLETNLCSMNQRTDEMAAGDLAAYTALLPNVPPEEADEPPGGPGSDLSIPVVTAVVLLSALALGAVTIAVVRPRLPPPAT